jgi:hypothetical protein
MSRQVEAAALLLVERAVWRSTPAGKKSSLTGAPLRAGLGTLEMEEKEPMRYLCLIYNEEKTLAAMPKAEYATFAAGHMSLDEELQKSRQYIASESLQSTQTATTVRIRNGKLSTTDGPFAETKEQLGGFFLIEARDLEEAIAVAARIPSARTGSIEVRPISEGGCRQPEI